MRCGKHIKGASARVGTALALLWAIGCAEASELAWDVDASVPAQDENDLDQVSVSQKPLTYGNLGLLDNPVTICFVTGPTPGTVAQAELDDIRDEIDAWAEGFNGLKFEWDDSPADFRAETFGSETYMTTCRRDSDDNFIQQVRIYVNHRSYAPKATPYPDSAKIPGCNVSESRGTQKKKDGQPVTDKNGLYKAKTGLWGTFPDRMRQRGKCLYTLHVSRNQARNNYLHEFGHCMGLSHEHDRSDACIDDPDDIGFKVTDYDRDSVMHYVQTCTDGYKTPGNWGTGGLTDLDRLGAEILYPQNLTPSIGGWLGGWEGGSMTAWADWERRGAYVTGANNSVSALRAFRWTVDGKLLSTRVRPSRSEWNTVPSGRHTLKLTLTDHIGRNHSGSVRVDLASSKSAYLKKMAASSVTMAAF
jgi:hypothetical protein